MVILFIISSFIPVSGPVGTTVTINGSGFSPTAAGNIVYFGAAFINQPIQLTGIDLNNSGLSTYFWSPANGLNNTQIANPIATPGNDITYLLTITTVDGCTSTARINIKVFSQPEIYVPTAFTPNSDAINDILKARPVGLKEFRLFSVYNRLGELVFSTTDAAGGWNGIYHSKAQPADIYVWIAEGVSFNGTIIRRKGTVALLR